MPDLENIPEKKTCAARLACSGMSAVALGFILGVLTVMQATNGVDILPHLPQAPKLAVYNPAFPADEQALRDISNKLMQEQGLAADGTSLKSGTSFNTIAPASGDAAAPKSQP